MFHHDKNGSIVWILSEDDGTVFGPYYTLPRSRTRATRERVVIFERTPDAGAAPTIRAWFGRNTLDGREFVDRATDRG